MERQNRFKRAVGGRAARPPLALAPRRRPELAAAGGALVALLLCAAFASAGAAEHACGLAARRFSGVARLLLVAPPPPPTPLPPPPPTSIDHFVRVVGGKFVAGPDCAELFVSGTNQWELMEAAGGALQLFGASLPENTTGPALVRALLDRAAAAGMNVVRAWAHPVSAQYALQSGPGEYSEAALRGLDYALDAARQRGIRLLLALTDNWQPPGGADQFAAWAGHAYHEDFFTAPEPRALFKAHVAALLARVNSVNGRRYSEDPTIFAFNLINEPRCYKCGGALAAWIADMAAFVKLHAPNHLLTVGEEGFYPAGSARASANPEAGGGAASWAETEGQDFAVDHADPNIDFAAIHLWHQNWEDDSEAFVRVWLRAHFEDAAVLGKPLLLEEFGAWGDVPGGWGADRDKWYRLVFEEVAASAAAGGPAKGALFWQFFAPGQRAPAEEGGQNGGLFGVFENSPTWILATDFAARMAALSGARAPPGACPPEARPGAPPPAPPEAACAHTRVGGRPGTGAEGVGCARDINECARGTAGCPPLAACEDLPGGYTCRCFPGHEGNGATCAPLPGALAAVEARYVTGAPGEVACTEGESLLHPPGAPGFAYDALGALERPAGSPFAGGRGSRAPVSPLGCMLACEAAPRCDAFAYNAHQRRCFLKALPPGGGGGTCLVGADSCTSARGQAGECGRWQTYWRRGGGAGGAAAEVAAFGGAA